MSIKFTMVMDEDTAKRMDYIASYYGRSRIKEIMWACKQYIKTFEENVDKIEIGDT
jgi:predicted transcriptional regulator